MFKKLLTTLMVVGSLFCSTDEYWSDFIAYHESQGTLKDLSVESNLIEYGIKTTAYLKQLAETNPDAAAWLLSGGKSGMGQAFLPKPASADLKIAKELVVDASIKKGENLFEKYNTTLYPDLNERIGHELAATQAERLREQEEIERKLKLEKEKQQEIERIEQEKQQEIERIEQEKKQELERFKEKFSHILESEKPEDKSMEKIRELSESLKLVDRSELLEVFLQKSLAKSDSLIEKKKKEDEAFQEEKRIIENEKIKKEQELNLLLDRYKKAKEEQDQLFEENKSYRQRQSEFAKTIEQQQLELSSYEKELSNSLNSNSSRISEIEQLQKKLTASENKLSEYDALGSSRISEIEQLQKKLTASENKLSEYDAQKSVQISDFEKLKRDLNISQKECLTFQTLSNAYISENRRLREQVRNYENEKKSSDT